MPEIETVRPGELGARVLVADDSPSVRTVLSELLAAAGYTVEAAESGEEAFEKVLTARYDVVVSDITMGALSGVQLCRLLRSDATTAHVPVVLLTAASDPRSRFWARNAGAAGYLAKESMRDVVVAEVDRVVIAHRRVDAGAPMSAPNVKPLSRLSRTLDDLLFDAVVASEVRRLLRCADDRGAFARGLLGLAGEIATYAYLVIRLDGPRGTSFTLDASSPWPAEPSDRALGALGIPPGTRVDVAQAPVEIGSAEVRGGDAATFAIQAGGEKLGELMAFGGAKPLGAGARRTLELVARESAIVAKTALLMEGARQLAQTDALTGLPNRRHTTLTLDRDVGLARRHQPLTVALCDIDHFKQINDRFGHNLGDVVLKRVAQVLQKTMRNVDVVGRWGGEEFLVILPNTAAVGARIAAERIRRAVETEGSVPGGPERVTVSLGVATFDGDASPTAFVDRADRAMYVAKKRGRNRAEIAPPPDPEPGSAPVEGGEGT